jgi:alkylation response protein AidB-like acyl-CoA dehydrogenase
MNFDFSDDQKMLKETAAGFLREHAPLAHCRAVLESDQSYSTTLWKQISELGWPATAIPEQYGGAGFGRLEVAMLAEEVGRSLAPIPFASSVYLATEALLVAGSEAQKKRYLPKLASGEWIGTFAVAERPGQNGFAGVAARLERDTLTGAKSPVLDGDVADFAVVAAQASAGPTLALVELPSPGVTRSRVESFDPSRSMARIELASVPAEPLGKPGEGRALLDRLFDRAAVLLAFEQVGAALRALEITREYALQRYAFGRPIGSFQAIKHRLADRWCDIELARSNAYFGAWALEHDAPELAVAACLSRIAASDAFDRMATDMIQIHGGVGFTWEFDCHLFYRRAKLLSTMLGTTASWKHKLVERVTEEAA